MSVSGTVRIARAFVRFMLGITLGGLLWGACAQDEGDRCEVTDDCKSGLLCVKMSNQISGVCESSDRPATDASTTPPVDAAVSVDTRDTATDTQSPTDVLEAAPDVTEASPEAAVDSVDAALDAGRPRQLSVS